MNEQLIYNFSRNLVDTQLYYQIAEIIRQKYNFVEVYHPGLLSLIGSTCLDRCIKEGMHDEDSINHPWARTIAFMTSVLIKYETGMKMKYKQ